MSKAIAGAVELAAGATLLFVPGMQFLGAKLTADVAVGLLLNGAMTEVGALAQALGTNTGMAVATRQAAGLRQIIRGTQRVGGTIIYKNTTGSSKRQMNMVIVIATHPCEAIENLYLDGRQVFWNTSSAYNQTVNGCNFGGDADSSNHTGPDGQQYNFGGKVFCAGFYGKQTSDPTVVGGTWVGPSTIDHTTVSYPGFCSALQANDPLWAPDSQGTPYAAGCTYVYLKLEADSATFPQEPEIRFTVRGKNDIYDPRTGTTGYTTNWALHVADAITDPVWGLGDNTVNQAQLIAAANVCDEMVSCAAGIEARYALNWHYDTSTGPGDVINSMMPGAAGRLSRIGGEWYIFPAYYQGPTYSFDENILMSDVQWTPKRSFSDLFNRVTGTYIAANYPYNVVGNLYDSNGYWSGMTANQFPYGFQPSNYPQYAADAQHGYGSDVYLTQDGNVILPREITQQTVLSVSQAQRVAKLFLLRNRQQGSGTFTCFPAAFQLQPADTFTFTSSKWGWTNKLLEVAAVTHSWRSNSEGVPQYTVELQVQETDPSVYTELASSEELYPANVQPITSTLSYIVAPPTSVAASSSLSTALVQPDGTVIPRIQVSWTEPNDTYVTNGGSIIVQMCPHGTGAWQTQTIVDGQTTLVFLSNVVSGQSYDVQVAARRSNGSQSDWVTLSGIAVGMVLNASGLTAVAPTGTLRSQVSGSTAQIIVSNFTATFGTATAACTPSPSLLTGLNQGQLYYVYYIDSSFAGGSITPVATQNINDFNGRLGYYLIGSLVTASSSPVFRPNVYIDSGQVGTINPTFAYDGNPLDISSVNGVGVGGTTGGSCQWLGFPQYTTASSKTLTVYAGMILLGTGSTAQVTVTIGGGSPTVLVPSGSSSTMTAYTMTIPSGTNLSTVAIQATATPGTGGLVAADVNVSDINIQ